MGRAFCVRDPGSGRLSWYCNMLVDKYKLFRLCLILLHGKYNACTISAIDRPSRYDSIFRLYWGRLLFGSIN